MRLWRYGIGGLACLAVFFVLTLFVFVAPLRAAGSTAARWAALPPEDRAAAIDAGEPVDLYVYLFRMGRPAPTQNMAFEVTVRNDDSEVRALADQVVLTVTLPSGVSYLSDTAGVSPNLQGQQVIWPLGNLPGGEELRFMLFLHVGNLPVETELITQAEVTSANDEFNPDDNIYRDYAYVEQNHTYLSVGLDSSAHEMAPGAITRHRVTVCNMGFTCSDTITVTHQLPVSMTVLGWESLTPGWMMAGGDAHTLVMTYPSLGGNGEIPVCAEFDVFAQVSLMAQDDEVLITTGDMVSPSDLSEEPGHGHAELHQTVTGLWADLSIRKKWLGGILTAGGDVHYLIQVRNEGTSGAANVRITDTLPLATVFVSAKRMDTHALFSPVLSDSQRVVWELPYLPVGDTFEFDVWLDIDAGAVPGLELTNLVQVEALPEEWLTANNIASWIESVHPSGANLRIHKKIIQDTPSYIQYHIDFMNVGDDVAEAPMIVDTYPEGMVPYSYYAPTYLSYSHYPASREVSFSSSPYVWIFPGQMDSIDLYFFASEPFGKWFTNAVTITSASQDVDLSDNVSTITTYGGSELAWVEVNVNHPYGVISGQIRPEAGFYNVYAQTPSGTYFTSADDGGYWEIWTWSTILPGDVITVTTSDGFGPVSITVPDPFEAEAEAGTGVVGGQVDEVPYTPLTVWLYSGHHRRTALGAAATYSVQFPAFPPGTGGHVAYQRLFSMVPVYLNRYFWDDTLSLHVDMSADEVAANYGPGHEVTVTLKGTDNALIDRAHVSTELCNGVLGNSGFHTHFYYGWEGGMAPNFQPYQTVAVQVDDGNTAEVRLGRFDLTLNPSADAVTGTLHA